MLSWKTVALLGRRPLCSLCMENASCQSAVLTSNGKISTRSSSALTLNLNCPSPIRLPYASSRKITKRYHASRPVVDSTMDEEELKHFRSLAKSWWDENGEFAALHTMNKLRVPFIRNGLIQTTGIVPGNSATPLEGFTIVDVGSGGGILSEPLARLGAFVIGLDPVEESTKIAQLHLQEDPKLLPRVKYINGSVEDLASTESETFDAVVASEVVEHVADLVSFIECCCKLIKPGGSIFITTMNKTVLSRSLAVFAAENILRIVPKGTHDWEKFVPPEDLKKILEKNHMHTRMVHGMLYLPVLGKWKWIKDTSINYALHAVKSDSDDLS